MSFDTNTTILCGRLTRDPETSMSSGGKQITKFSIACGHGKDKVSYFDIVTFDKTAETCARFLSKGKQVIVDGKLQQDRWQDKETGKNRSKISIIGKLIQFVGGNGSQDGSGMSQGQPSGNQPQQNNQDNGFGGFDNNSDLPF